MTFQSITISLNTFQQSLCMRAVRAYSLQSSPTLYDHMDYGQPDSSVHGILQATVLEWVAMPSSERFSRPSYRTHIFCVFCISRQVLYH